MSTANVRRALGLEEGDRGCVVIAEVAQGHDGSLGTAHAYIDAVAAAGADAVKFQTHLAAAESSRFEPWRVQFSPQDETRFDYWQRMEFTEPQWAGLAEHAREAGLLFLSSPFSPAAVELLERVGVAAWKVASGELTNLPLVAQMAATGKPVLLSTGMATWAEIEAAVAVVEAAGALPVVFQCTSAYPCPPEQIGLNVLSELRSRGWRVGMSDHSGTVFVPLAAAALGIDVLEVHVVASRELFGPDVSSSITTVELRQVMEGLRWLHRATTNPVDKDAVAAELAPLRDLFTKSVVATADLPAGSVLRVGDLATKKPGTGIPAAQLHAVVGRTLAVAVEEDEPIAEHHLEPAP
jgi:N-acetylneuraminate synthase